MNARIRCLQIKKSVGGMAEIPVPKASTDELLTMADNIFEIYRTQATSVFGIYI